MLKVAAENIPVNEKSLSASCKNCDRMIEIEGEMVCFEHGKIKRLIPDTSPQSLIKMVCIGWRKK
ncbi:hypothetical protein GCM10009347_18860 [Shewanella algicola]|uniref:Uncharacterized protein n=1 Tax=Shewanella algicola TaxID=640633 RepID=A0A9X1Z450_9GAMM|nr:hypothetical protein [Shewanella algicola]MCL1105561.1 hypothetical protein [Shewanella algicola]GGP52086.1 hypothetical protein GCM10009347_18860 [Shewanella algicola]